MFSLTSTSRTQRVLVQEYPVPSVPVNPPLPLVQLSDLTCCHRKRFFDYEIDQVLPAFYGFLLPPLLIYTSAVAAVTWLVSHDISFFVLCFLLARGQCEEPLDLFLVVWISCTTSCGCLAFVITGPGLIRSNPTKTIEVCCNMLFSVLVILSVFSICCFALMIWGFQLLAISKDSCRETAPLLYYSVVAICTFIAWPLIPTVSVDILMNCYYN
jgi:hypothetical protein